MHVLTQGREFMGLFRDMLICHLKSNIVDWKPKYPQYLVPNLANMYFELQLPLPEVKVNGLHTPKLELIWFYLYTI